MYILQYNKGFKALLVLFFMAQNEQETAKVHSIYYSVSGNKRKSVVRINSEQYSKAMEKADLAVAIVPGIEPEAAKVCEGSTYSRFLFREPAFVAFFFPSDKRAIGIAGFTKEKAESVARKLGLPLEEEVEKT